MRGGRLAALVLCLAVPWLMAMGLDESKGPTSIPEPRDDFKVRLTDQTGSRVELEQFAIAGQTYILGHKGKGEVAVPLAKVSQAEFSMLEGKLNAQLTMKNEPAVEITMDPAMTATGRASYGNYRITLGEVRRLEVLGMGGYATSGD